MTYLAIGIAALISLSIVPGLAHELDRYGGTKTTQREATGFFRTEKIDERSYFITPDGHPYIALGGNHVGSYLQTQAKAGGLLAANANDPDQSAAALLASLRDLGLNAGDAYQPDSRFARQIPWIFSFHYSEDRKRTPPNIFDEAAVAEMAEHVTAACRRIADNPWVIGVAGPDLPKWDRSYVEPYRQGEPGSSERVGYEDFLRSRHDSIESFNAAYGTPFADWEELAEKSRLNGNSDSSIARSDEEAFLALLADRHFASLRAACKAGAPNHLFLGERTQLRTIPDSVLMKMGKHIDVFCTQSLIRLPKSPPEWQVFQMQYYDHEQAIVKRPVIIVDWAAPFTLKSEPVETDYGTLKSEEESAREAAKFVEDCFESDYMIGLFICQVIGTHPNDSFFSKAKRTYLKDSGEPYAKRTEILKGANKSILRRLYRNPDRK